MRRKTEVASRLVGRLRERGELDRLVAGLREGVGGVLVIRGEAGAGKSALLDDLAARAAGCRVLRSSGEESEAELGFAGLQRLCAPLLDRLDSLTPSERDALAGAVGLGAGQTADRPALGLALRSLLQDAARSAPLLCLIDDADRLDRASMQVLAFVARRPPAESVGLVFASRRGEADDDLADLPQLALSALGHDDACLLLGSVIGGPVHEGVRERIIAEAAGRPGPLLQSLCGRDPAAFAGGFGLPDAAPGETRAELSFAQRVAQSRLETRQLLLLAAAEPTGDVALLCAAAERRGLDLGTALRDAGDLISVSQLVRFRHPLMRAAVYRAASAEERRAVHGALAGCLTQDADADRRAWHRAHATIGADESVAAQLETAAASAATRGGIAARAAFLLCAVMLTPDPRHRAQRALAAARASQTAGATDAAAELLALARCGPLDERDAGESLLLEGQIAAGTRRVREASTLCHQAARSLGHVDAARSRDAYLQAMWAVCIRSDATAQREIAAAVRAAPPPPGAPRPEDLLLDAMATRLLDGDHAAVPSMRAAMDAFRRAPIGGVSAVCWMWLAGELGDADALRDVGSRQVKTARDTGARSVLPASLQCLATWHALAGEFAVAESMLAESDATTAATGVPPINDLRLLLLALRGDGDRDDIESQIAESIRMGLERGDGALVCRAHVAAAVYYVGLSRYHEALEWAGRESDLNHHTLWMSALPELVEAAVHCQDSEMALWAAHRLGERARATGTAWTRGVAARSLALVVSDSGSADGLFAESVSLLAETGLTVELARAELLYGEWLRREHRRRDSREQLRRAHERFAGIGATAFAERAARELHATGETVRRRCPETRDELTAQELQVATMAAAGHTNPQIGGRLSISPRTVEWHLRKIFSKLEISSRRQLKVALGASAAVAVADDRGGPRCGVGRERISARPIDRRRYAGSLR